MGSFIAIHIENCDERTLLSAVESWLGPFGFGEVARYEGVPPVLNTIRFRAADAVGVERLNDSWHIVMINAFRLGNLTVDEAAVAPLAERLQTRVVLFGAQTTGGVYQLAVFERGHCIRNLLCSDCQLLTNVGPPLPGERRGVFTDSQWTGDGKLLDDEDAPPEMEDAKAICAALGFELWRSPPLRGPGYFWRRRTFLSRLLGG